MTPEEMKSTWESLSFGNSPSMNDPEISRRLTSLDRLAKRYQRFSRIGLVMVIVSFSWVGNMAILAHYRLAVSIVFMAFFGVCSVFDHWLYGKIKEIDCYRMTVREVAMRAMMCRKRHLQFVMAGVPCAIAVVGFMVYAAGGDAYFLAGIVCGAIIGLCIGIRELMRFMADYRDLT